MRNDLSDAEKELISTIPRPPVQAEIRTSNVWVIEWLPATDRQTGLELHAWMKERRDGWSVYIPCRSKSEVLAAIAKATERARGSSMAPVLHLEAHGCDRGLVGPDGHGGSELLTWDELTDPLQELNLATRCNLVVFVAACTGFAGIQAFWRGPRAPAVALVGPDELVMPGDLLRGTKEFYRRWHDASPTLANIAESASREMVGVVFEVEPFVVLAYEAVLKNLIESTRPAERIRRKEKLRQRLLAETCLSPSEIERRLELPSKSLPYRELQIMWDKMFMIDLYEDNRMRFGVDWNAIVAMFNHRAAN